MSTSDDTRNPIEKPVDNQPRWRGINHLAMVTPDMDETVRFYHGVLGMRVVATLKAGPMRHYFFEIGPENTIAFFEVKGTNSFEVAAGMPDPRKAQFDHLSFNLPDEDALYQLQRRLKEANCAVTDVVDHNIVRSIYFHDPHGIALEASWWVRDATGRPADYYDPQYFADNDPVPAVRELAERGELDWLPTSELAGDQVTDPV